MIDYYTETEVLEIVDNFESLKEYLNGFPDAINVGLYKRKYVDMYLNR
jgi:hypothetical protein